MKVLASSSAGNCFAMGDLLVECGIPVKDIMRGCDYRAPAACLITHEHKDHSRAAKDLAALGVPLWASAGTLDALQVKGTALTLNEWNRVDGRCGSRWTVFPFRTVHDAADPVGFIVAEGDERVLFVTDTAELRYTFTGLTEIVVECNYSQLRLLESTLDLGARIRTAGSHLSLETLVDFLVRTDLSQVRNITLVHLSDAHSDEEEFRRTIEGVTGRPVRIAERNMERRRG